MIDTQQPRRTQPGSASPAMRPVPGYERLLRMVLAVAIAGGPLGYLLGGLFRPAIHTSAWSTVSAAAAR